MLLGPSFGRLGLAAVALAILVASGPAWAQVGHAKERPSLAILPVVVHSGDDPAYLRSGLADMLASRISQADILEVVRVDTPEAATTDIDQAIERGRALGVDFVLFGSFTRFGDGASLDLQCVATEPLAGREPLREIFVHSGSLGSLIPDLGHLVGKVSRFIVSDFEERLAEAEATEQEAESEVARLRSRIRALEEAVQRLDSGPDVGAPGDAAELAAE